MKKLLTEWRKFINESAEMPAKLYHATYEHFLSSIQTDGLGGDRDTQWDDSRRGVVYLATDPYIAESYAETAEAYEENEDYKIVILEVDTSPLEQSLFQIDRNVIGSEGETVEYHGVVPPAAIKVMGAL